MFEVLILIIPFGLAGAVSPVMLTEQTVLLAGKDGQRVGRRFAAGASLVMAAWITLLVIFGSAISLPEEPRLSASLDLIIGLLLILAALAIRHGRIGRPTRKKTKTSSHGFGPHAALGFGAFAMATNFTTLAFVVPGAKAIAAGGLDVPERAVLVLVLTAIVSTPAWLPVALTKVAPGPGQRVLHAIADFIQTYGRRLTVFLLGALGLLLVVRGALHIAGL
ncbi:MAG: GAP family protein [Solirubrobacterales bacterium]